MYQTQLVCQMFRVLSSSFCFRVVLKINYPNTRGHDRQESRISARTAGIGAKEIPVRCYRARSYCLGVRAPLIFICVNILNRLSTVKLFFTVGESIINFNHRVFIPIERSMFKARVKPLMPVFLSYVEHVIFFMPARFARTDFLFVVAFAVGH